MFYSEKKEVEEVLKKEGSKRRRGLDEKTLCFHFKKTLTLLEKSLENDSEYDFAQTINGLYHYIEDRKHKESNSFASPSYIKGTIVLVDFGTMNFGYEFNDVHPAVVLTQNKFQVMVVPCTSEKCNRNIPDSLQFSKDDGFKKDSIVLIDQIRYISKNRVISNLGYISNTALINLQRFVMKKILSV